MKEKEFDKDFIERVERMCENILKLHALMDKVESR